MNERCVRCGRAYPTHPLCALCERHHEEFTDCPAEDELIAVPEEAWEWVYVYDGKSGRACPDCATEQQRRRDDDRCVRCGEREPDVWDEQRDGEWCRITEDGGACPRCFSPADAAYERASIERLSLVLDDFNLKIDDAVLERTKDDEVEANRLSSGGPESLLS